MIKSDVSIATTVALTPKGVLDKVSENLVFSDVEKDVNEKLNNKPIYDILSKKECLNLFIEIIQFHYRIFKSHVQGLNWENYFSVIIEKYAGKMELANGGHESGVDVKTDLLGNFSNKTNKISPRKRKNSKFLTVSSHTFSKLVVKNTISIENVFDQYNEYGKSYNHYAICAREDVKEEDVKKVDYHFYVIPKEFPAYDMGSYLFLKRFKKSYYNKFRSMRNEYRSLCDELLEIEERVKNISEKLESKKQIKLNAKHGKTKTVDREIEVLTKKLEAIETKSTEYGNRIKDLEKDIEVVRGILFSYLRFTKSREDVLKNIFKKYARNSNADDEDDDSDKKLKGDQDWFGLRKTAAFVKFEKKLFKKVVSYNFDEFLVKVQNNYREFEELLMEMLEFSEVNRMEIRRNQSWQLWIYTDISQIDTKYLTMSTTIKPKDYEVNDWQLILSSMNAGDKFGKEGMEILNNVPTDKIPELLNYIRSNYL